ncbi:MAG: hypothetical protein LBD55_10075 [Treponema sp.]|jgi:hypothetical protein|nr:hypothetical protein [Treponema sp.]
MEHILLAQIPPDTRKHRDKVFIVDRPCCDVFFGLDMENAIFDMSEEALFNTALRKDGIDVSRRLSDTANRLIASEKSVVLIRYQPDVLRAMGDLAAEVWNKFGDLWLFLRFSMTTMIRISGTWTACSTSNGSSLIGVNQIYGLKAKGAHHGKNV